MYKFKKTFQVFELAFDSNAVNIELGCIEPELNCSSNYFYKLDDVNPQLNLPEIIQKKLEGTDVFIRINFVFTNEPTDKNYSFQIDEITNYIQPNDKENGFYIEAETVIYISSLKNISQFEDSEPFSMICFTLNKEELENIISNPNCCFEIIGIV